jgi:hypothetical protein
MHKLSASPSQKRESLLCAEDGGSEDMLPSSAPDTARTPVSMHVQALTESLHTLHRLKASHAPLTPQCKDMIAQLDSAAQMSSGNSLDSPISGTFSSHSKQLPDVWDHTGGMARAFFTGKSVRLLVLVAARRCHSIDHTSSHRSVQVSAVAAPVTEQDAQKHVSLWKEQVAHSVMCFSCTREQKDLCS